MNTDNKSLYQVTLIIFSVKTLFMFSFTSQAEVHMHLSNCSHSQMHLKPEETITLHTCDEGQIQAT